MYDSCTKRNFSLREMSCEEKVFGDAVLSLENFYQANVAIRTLKSPSARVKYSTNDRSVIPEYKPTTNGFKQLAYESPQTSDDASHNLRVFAKLLRDIDSVQYPLNEFETVRDCVQNCFDMLSLSEKGTRGHVVRTAWQRLRGVRMHQIVCVCVCLCAHLLTHLGPAWSRVVAYW